MFENTQELAESKLLLLYIFNKLKLPISNTLITEIVLENNLLNYFHLQQYLSELADSGFLSVDREYKKQLYSITPKGKDVLVYFENRITKAKKDIIKAYFDNHSDLLKKEVQITADYYPENERGYIVTCRITEDNAIIIDLKITVESNEKAQQICAKWKANPYQVYSKLLTALTN